jgi:hypothetical protein
MWENPCKLVVDKMKMRKFSSKIFDITPLLNIPPMPHTHAIKGWCNMPI